MKIKLHFPFIIFMLTCMFFKTNAQWDIDTVSFEIPTPLIVIDTTDGNLWQIGTPQKMYFDAAYSGANAILTDTLNDYPPNDTSSFIYVIRNPYTQTCLTCMEFWHQYDMDSLSDKGMIDASYDGGVSWVVVKDTFINNLGSLFIWNADYHANTGNSTAHPLLISGKSDGWIHSGFCWQWFLPVSPDTIIANPDSLLIRFTFIADSLVKHKDGWMIDEIVTGAARPELCSSIKETDADEKVTIYPNPFSTYATVQTEKQLKDATLIICNSLGQPVKHFDHVYGQTIFLQRDALPSGIYFLQLSQRDRILKTVKIVITGD